MPIPAIPTFVTVGLLRLGYKFAENKKWLPDYIYHNISINKLKEGDLEKALYFNRIAISKNPKSEKAQIMRDIINMRKDKSLVEIEAKIFSEHQAINLLTEQYQQNLGAIRNYKLQQKLQQSVFVLFTLTYLAGMFLFYFFNYSIMFYILLALGILVFAGIFIYHRTIGLGAGISETISHQERLISLQTRKAELEHRKRQLQKYNNDLEKIIRDFV